MHLTAISRLVRHPCYVAYVTPRDRDRARRLIALTTGGITLGAVAATGATMSLAQQETARRDALRAAQKTAAGQGAQLAAALETQKPASRSDNRTVVVRTPGATPTTAPGAATKKATSGKTRTSTSTGKTSTTRTSTSTRTQQPTQTQQQTQTQTQQPTQQQTQTQTQQPTETQTQQPTETQTQQPTQTQTQQPTQTQTQPPAPVPTSGS